MNLIIGHIDYINVIPVDVELVNPRYRSSKILGVPAILNRELLNGCVDVGFFSSVFYLRNRSNLEIAGPYCIASKNEAMSVIIGSEIDLEKKKGHTIKVFETPASETSIFLSRVIFRDYFGVHLKRAAREDSEAFVLIGDEALLAVHNGQFKYIYDIGSFWKEITGHPAVFAVLTTRKDVRQTKAKDLEAYLADLEKALRGFEADTSKAVAIARNKIALPEEFIARYYASLNYRLTDREAKSLEVLENYLKIEEQYAPEQD